MVNSPTNGSTVIGRYAYAVYHEGGLLDANVAGYPMGNSSPPATGTNQYAYKPALSYADLTQIGLTQAQVDQLVAWRNYASARWQGHFNHLLYTSIGSNYYASVMNNPSGFINVSGTGLNPGTGILGSSGQSDRMFASRQELIAFMQRGFGAIRDRPQRTQLSRHLYTRHQSAEHRSRSDAAKDPGHELRRK